MSAVSLNRAGSFPHSWINPQTLNGNRFQLSDGADTAMRDVSEAARSRIFERIIGDSSALQSTLRQVQLVAPTDSSILIHGETGTGKELIADAIHNLSPRRQHNIVKINCAAIPSGLLESELFGHERGAFTGAISQRVGRFQLAHKGTLFLDEIGDLPLELQPKLLRVLQDQEFERLGSSRTLKSDVRVITATHRDLAGMVQEGKFRSDLYYRLNIFPITAPPLRERGGDVVLLARHFADKYARAMKKRFDDFPPEVMSALPSYDWPGNVRELQNVIERAVIMSEDGLVHPQLPESQRPAIRPSAGSKTLKEVERQHILDVLSETRWVVAGPAGAAAKLGLNRTTLACRMQKLGIVRPSPASYTSPPRVGEQP
jgi:formate hydrogenlyase transcriptional activator